MHIYYYDINIMHIPIMTQFVLQHRSCIINFDAFAYLYHFPINKQATGGKRDSLFYLFMKSVVRIFKVQATFAGKEIITTINLGLSFSSHERP